MIGDWASDRVLLLFRMEKKDKVKFSMRFSFPTEIYSRTGPITVYVRINGMQFCRERYDQPGDYVQERPVPTAFFGPDSLTRVDLIIDKYFLTEDNARLAVLLQEAGFILTP